MIHDVVIENGELKYETYGINTGEIDAAKVDPDFILGKYEGKIPVIGRFFNFLKTTPGYFICIFVPFMLLILYQGVNFFRLFRRYKKEQMEEMAVELIHGVGDWLELWQAKSIASLILVSGWIKPDKDSVVLSKEEYQLWNVLKTTWASDYKEVSAEDMLETLKNTKELGSKETAEKIYQQLQGHGTTYVKKWIKEQFGVEFLYVFAET